MSVDNYDIEEYNRYIDEMDIIVKEAEEVDIPLRDYLLEQVGVKENTVDALLQVWNKEISEHELFERKAILRVKEDKKYEIVFFRITVIVFALWLFFEIIIILFSDPIRPSSRLLWVIVFLAISINHLRNPREMPFCKDCGKLFGALENTNIIDSDNVCRECEDKRKSVKNSIIDGFIDGKIGDSKAFTKKEVMEKYGESYPEESLELALSSSTFTKRDDVEAYEIDPKITYYRKQERESTPQREV